jgi:siroheme synthase
MPGYEYHKTAHELQRAGVPGGTACAIISQATSSHERVHVTTVEDLDKSLRLPSPTLLVVGEVVRMAKPAALREQFAWTDLVPPVFRDQIGGTLPSHGWLVNQERAD